MLHASNNSKGGETCHVRHPRESRASWRRATLALSVALAQQASAIEPTASVVEFYNASLNHYFITADAGEAAMLDQGVAFPGGPEQA